ncbi:UNVERIFIED_ORG: hypothetical protein GGD58_002927 [Rhizobium pisi]
MRDGRNSRRGGADAQESLTLRCPAGASKGKAGAPSVDGGKEQRWNMFEAPAYGLRESG